VSALFAILLGQSGTGGSLIDQIKAASNYSLAWEQAQIIFTLIMGGLLVGIATWISLNRFRIHLTLGQVTAMVAAWIGGLFLAALFSIQEVPVGVMMLGWFLGGALGGWATGAALHKNVPGFDRQALLKTVLGWAVALAVGEWLNVAIFYHRIYSALYDAGAGDFADHIALPLVISLFYGVMGLMGGWVMFTLLGSRRTDEGQQAAKT
jgi:hypothetical protein